MPDSSPYLVTFSALYGAPQGACREDSDGNVGSFLEDLEMSYLILYGLARREDYETAAQRSRERLTGSVLSYCDSKHV